jgi:hypothetical protein
VLPRVGDRLVYVYDFGDSWEHLIEVEAVHRPAPRVRYPRCPAGAGACPPEDRGGPPGYHDLQRALRARKGWRYQQARDAFGPGRWDPAALEPLRPPAEPTTGVVPAERAAAAAVRTALDTLTTTVGAPVEVALARLHAAHSARTALDAEID